MVGGHKLPPQLTYINIIFPASYGTSLYALLHQVYASCSRVFSFATFLFVKPNLL